MKSRLFLSVAMSITMLAYGQNQIDRIAFGACSFQFGKQQVWKSVIKQEPNLWIWLGDNIYGDTEDMVAFAAKYAQLDSNANYRLLKQTMPIIATWDDHDYGGNNLGKHYPKKAESKNLFLTFFGEPKDSPRWNRQGVYTSYTYGAGDRKVKVILLDTRYNRDDPSPDGDMLGEEQWKWLEDEFRNSDVKITIIASSIQFVNTFKKFETWNNFPKSKQRMLDLIASTQLKGAMFISGDVHLGEISRHKYDAVSYPIVDFTSSGLTHGNQITGFRNPFRVGPRWGFRNFATVEFDWEKQEVGLLLHDMLGTRIFKHEVPFTELGY